MRPFPGAVSRRKGGCNDPMQTQAVSLLLAQVMEISRLVNQDPGKRAVTEGRGLEFNGLDLP